MMEQTLQEVRESFIELNGRITTFWGYGKVMGELYAVLYLSPQPMTLDEMREALGVSKATVSTNIRNLERIGMVRKVFKKGDRRDYYEAETDFWGIARAIFREREKKEFDNAVEVVAECLRRVERSKGKRDELKEFYVERLKMLHEFFSALATIVDALLSLKEMRAATVGELPFVVAGKK